jgi:leucyl/phenylalanyl-tRNA--protein transferase
MVDAYCALHEAGYAHSVECWKDGQLAGGLYGVSLGACFFGESMFSHEPNASKVAFVSLVRQVAAWGFSLVDCQMHTPHLERFGAQEIPRKRFLALLRDGLKAETRRGPWRFGGK